MRMWLIVGLGLLALASMGIVEAVNKKKAILAVCGRARLFAGIYFEGF